MSVTFSLPPGFRLAVRPIDDSEAEDDRYWAERVSVDGELNVANVNAAWILEAVLGEEARDLYGSLDVTIASMRLAAFTSPESGVEQATVTGRFHQGGRTLEQAQSYLQRLGRLVEIAQQRGAPEIIWG